jgi:hypothetical protein
MCLYFNYGIASTKICYGFLECLTYFLIDGLILLLVSFVELLEFVYASFLFIQFLVICTYV